MRTPSETHYLKEAQGFERADLVIRNCRLVNVLSGEIENGVDIAIKGDQIVGIGHEYKGHRELDAAGRYVYPALIDAHIHLESTKLTVREAGRMMARFGTGTVVTDPHEIGNVAGLEGIGFQMDSAKDNGFINVCFVAPSCVPTLNDPAIETAPSDLDTVKLCMTAAHSSVVGLGEVMNVPGILMGDAGVHGKIRNYRERGLAIDGHAPMVSGAALNACVYAGIQSDHESTSLEEAREKLRRGMVVMIREGSSEKNLDTLLPLVNPHNVSRLMFASDDLDPSDLAERGHINHLVRRAVSAGLDPVTAVQMATLSPASYFGILHRVGAIYAGAQADLVVAQNLVDFIPDIVLHGGDIVFENDHVSERPMACTPHLRPTMNVKLPELEAFRVPAEPGTKLRIIELVPGQILTREKICEAIIKDGEAIASPESDLLKVCVFDRHRGSGSFGIGFVRGYGMKHGAVGSSVGHDSHNLVIVGTNDADMLKCAELIRDLGGGQAGVCGDKSCALPLPIAGLMSDKTADEVIKLETELDLFCTKQLGVALARPFAALSFMSLPVIPEIRITDQGLFKIEPGGYPQKIALQMD